MMIGGPMRNRLSVFLLLACISAASLSCGGDSGSSTGGEIAFESNQDGRCQGPNELGCQIYLMNSDGSNPRNLSNNSFSDVDPAWSPDGNQIAFVRDAEIYVMNADGSNQINLSNNNGVNLYPTWSPDGRLIAYTFADGPVAPRLYVMNADGSNQRALEFAPCSDCFEPAWSPDGNEIAFVASSDSNYQIWVSDSDGSNPRNLSNTSSFNGSPAWSPDGSQIAFTSDRSGNSEIYLMNSDGTNQRNISNTPSRDEGQPSWSRDGSQITFTDCGSDLCVSPTEIYVMNADGSNQVKISNNPVDPPNDQNPVWRP